MRVHEVDQQDEVVSGVVGLGGMQAVVTYTVHSLWCVCVCMCVCSVRMHVRVYVHACVFGRLEGEGVRVKESVRLPGK